MSIGEHSDSIPMDLIHEIFSRLPAKSIARFRCVSKLWGSIRIRPRLLFALERANHELLVFSSRQPQQPYGKSSSYLVVAADFHMKISKGKSPEFRCLTSNLIYFSDMKISKNKGCDMEPVIYNPITGQYENLPKLSRYRKSYSFLGFDPVGKQFKVIFMAYPFCGDRDDHRILTLGTREKTWRKIKFSLIHVPVCEGMCINGVVYYIGEVETSSDSGEDEFSEKYQIVCFDVRSEKFKTVDAECFCDPLTTTLINYKGKLAGIDLTYDDADAIKLCIWVLEDVERQEWSKHVFTLPENEVAVYKVFVVGMTTTGEIVLSDMFTCKPFYVFYFNPERNTLQSVEIRGVGEYHEAFDTDCKVYAFVDYVVDFKFLT